jgi:hypothetical protein
MPEYMDQGFAPGEFQKQAEESASNEGQKIAAHRSGKMPSPDEPLDPLSIPPHMRHIIAARPGAQPEALQAEIGEVEPELRGNDGERRLPPIPSRRGISETVQSPDENELALSPQDRPVPPNVIGKNVETGRDIVRPKKPDDNPFAEAEEEREKRAAEVIDTYAGGSNVSEILRHIQRTTDYHPYTLPSRGILYPSKSKLSDGKILLRPMRGDDEEIILSPNLLRDGEAIEMILRRCIVFEDRTALTDPLEMLSQDRIAALVVIRALTYGQYYECEVNCTRCGHAFESSVDLDNDIDVHFCADPNLREPFEEVFPTSGIKFTYRLPRGYDEREIVKHVNARRKKGKVKTEREDVTTVRASRLVTSIGGNSNKDDIEKILSVISLNDRAHLRQLFDYPPFGIDTRVNFDCPNCQAENKLRLPMGVDFFLQRRENRKR